MILAQYTIPDPLHVVLGLLAGLAFGFLLEKGGVTRFRVIVGQFLLRDFTVLRVMVTAVVVGAAGVWFLFGRDWGVEDHVKDTQLLANAVGGAIFGIGMAILGYCPGTGVGAAGHGSRHAIVGLVGMLAGAALYAEVYPWAREHVLPVGDHGEITLPGVTGWSPWIFVGLFAIAAIITFVLLSGADRPVWKSRRNQEESS
jgi:hypothetical protein